MGNTKLVNSLGVGMKAHGWISFPMELLWSLRKQYLKSLLCIILFYDCDSWFVFFFRLYATKVMFGCVEDELRAMRGGLHDVIPSELMSSLTPEDFQLLVSGGTTDVDINRLRSVITFSNSNGCSADILERFKR